MSNNVRTFFQHDPRKKTDPFDDRGDRPSSAYTPHSSATAQELREKEKELEKIKDEPSLVATVVEIRTDGKMLVALGPGNAINIHALKGARVGDRVLLTRNTMQALEIVRDKVPAGNIVAVEQVTGEIVEGTIMGLLKAFHVPSHLKIRKGERVLVDPSMSFVIGTLGMPPPVHAHAQKISVSWSDVGGHEIAKEALREAIELPAAHAELFAAYGKRPVRGVMLYGPAGCGKTLIAKAAATSLARAHGEQATSGFIYVKGPELMNSYIGKTEEAVRAMFAAAREHKAKHGYPALIFMDECDALLGQRDRGVNVSINATVVPQFLAEMDGLDDHAALLLLATNRPEMLDPAVVREGRVDRKVKIGRPTAEDARGIFEIHLRNRPLDGDGHVAAAIGALYSDERVVRDYGEVKVCMRHFVSGAMIAEIVEQASTMAILRDVAGNRKRAVGVSAADLEAAVERAMAGLADTNHSEIVRELTTT